MTRAEQVREAATDLKIRACVFRLKHLGMKNRRRVRAHVAVLSKEPRELIDDGKKSGQ